MLKETVLAHLMANRHEACFPPEVRPRSLAFLQICLALLFPHFAESESCTPESLSSGYDRSEDLLRLLAHDLAPEWKLEGTFLGELPRLQTALMLDARAMFDGDPAATSLDEVILSYPGFFAVAVYRIAHELHRLSFPILPRMLTEIAHRETGIDIHPGAEIGREFCIDHGTGVVIGETAHIGNQVRLYQGVTLGALVIEKSLAQSKRHPTVEDRVVIYANATILGGETVIGHDSIVAANAWITESVPAFSFSGRNAAQRPRKEPGGDLPDYMI